MGGWRKTPVALLVISAIDAQESHSHECVDLDGIMTHDEAAQIRRTLMSAWI